MIFLKVYWLNSITHAWTVIPGSSFDETTGEALADVPETLQYEEGFTWTFAVLVEGSQSVATTTTTAVSGVYTTPVPDIRLPVTPPSQDSNSGGGASGAVIGGAGGGGVALVSIIVAGILYFSWSKRTAENPLENKGPSRVYPEGKKLQDSGPLRVERPHMKSLFLDAGHALARSQRLYAHKLESKAL